MTETTAASQPPPETARIVLASSALPRRDRVALFCEAFARQIMGVHVEPARDRPFRVDMDIRRLGDFAFWSYRNSPMSACRTRETIASRDDGILLGLTGRPVVANQVGRETFLDPGDAIVLSVVDPGTVTHPGAGEMLVLLPSHNALGPLLRDIGRIVGRRIPGNAPALRLLRSYVPALMDEAAMADPDLRRVTVTHVYDLLALALGATRDAAEVAKGRGVSAAHLRIVKTHIAENCGRALPLDSVAARHRIRRATSKNCSIAKKPRSPPSCGTQGWSAPGAC